MLIENTLFGTEDKVLLAIRRLQRTMKDKKESAVSVALLFHRRRNTKRPRNGQEFSMDNGKEEPGRPGKRETKGEWTTSKARKMLLNGG